MFKWINGLLDRIFAVAGALLFSQAPVFIQQYKQQLAGRVAELQSQVEKMRWVAHQSGKTLDMYIQKFVSQSDADFARQGELMQGMVMRHADLSTAHQALFESTVFSRPLVFARHFDFAIAKQTYSSFEFGFLFSIEGLVYSIIGVGIGYFAYYLFSRSVSSLLVTR